MKRDNWKRLAVLVLGCAMLTVRADSRQTPELNPVKAWRKTAAVKEKTFAPVLEQNSIRFGSKILQFSPDGKIQCSSPDAGLIFSGSPAFWLVDGKKADWNWREKHFNREKSKFCRDGQKYIWELWYQSKDYPAFRGVDQIMEVLPDGRLAFSFRFNMPEPAAGRRFSVWSFLINLPEATWLEKQVSLDGDTRTLDRKFKNYGPPAKNPQAEWIFAEKDPAIRFSAKTVKTENAGMRLYYRGKEGFGFYFVNPKEKGKFNKVYLDFRQGTESTGEIRGGVDFKKQENLVLPDISHKNMITNPSFERGWDGWHSKYGGHEGWNSFEWDPPFSLDEQVVYEGKHSLRVNIRTDNTWCSANPIFGPMNLVLEPGFYTLSFYAKGEPGKKTTLLGWIPCFQTGSTWQAINNNTARWKFPITDRWQRYQITFEVKRGEPLTHPIFYARDPSRKSSLWLDAFQLEKGKQATAYAPPPAEGRLITSSPDNFNSSREKINGRLRITTAKPDAAGKVRITVKNFFGEILLDQTRDFKTGKDRTAELALPLDTLPGLGLFVLRADYTLADGTRAYDFRRYAKVEFQLDPKPNKRVFSFDYGDTSRSYNFLKKLERWQKLGVGAKHHVGNHSKKVFDAYEKYGIEPLVNTMLNYKYGVRQGARVEHFFILDTHAPPSSVPNINDPRILVRDFHLDSDGTITPAYLEKLKQAAKKMAAKYPHVPLWGLGGELTAKLPNDWWGKGDTKQDSLRKLAQLLKAFAEGVREGNPKAKIFQDDPWNMAPRSGIEETDQLLEECSKIGLRFDVIAIHTYRRSPEDPDTDSDAQTLLDMLEKRGYGKTPVIWPEGMHWGPFDIPQWGTVSSSCDSEPHTWRGRLLSYDMGWTEKKSAAWYMRSWLVALKYADRVRGATAGNTGNNCYMDYQLTPYASQLMPNTLCAILGDAKFRKDVRFVPYTRTYIFEDAQKRPVAAVWCHKEEVDNGSADAPIASADFGGILESVKDIMNSDRAFKAGVMEFPVSTFPLFFRGKPGTLNQMIAAFEKAKLVSGSAVPVVSVGVTPADRRNLRVTLQNRTSNEFSGKFNGQPIKIPVLKKMEKLIAAKRPLKADAITRQQGEIRLESDSGAKYDYQYDFETLLIKKVPDQVTFGTVNWENLPSIKFVRRLGKTTNTGSFRVGWNRLGLFIEAKIKDPKFVHVEYPQGPSHRWKNDCLQVYIDTFANARSRMTKGYDEDDYEYAVYPNSKGDSAQVFRYRLVDSQLGLATQAPKERTFAPDMPCSFSNRDGVLTYRAFFPAKYLLPMQMQKGWVFGFGLFAMDSNRPDQENGALTLASDGGGCHQRPHTWPAAVLVE